MRRWLAIFGCMAGVWAAAAASAADRETIEKRVADAVDLYLAEGAGALCAAVNDANGPFLADEAYVFVLIRSGRLICHPRPDLNAMQHNGSHVPRMLRNTEAQPGGAWTRYPWPHPDTLEVGVKSTFCRIAGRLIICAGSYFDVGAV